MYTVNMQYKKILWGVLVVALFVIIAYFFITPLSPRSPVRKLLQPISLSSEELERVSCQTDDDCVTSSYVGCCWLCDGKAINKRTAEKEEENRKTLCAIAKREDLCPLPYCGMPRNEFPVCRRNKCVLESNGPLSAPYPF